MIKLPPLEPCHWGIYQDIRNRDLEIVRIVLEAAAIWYNDEGRELCRSDVAAELRALEFHHG